MTDLFLWWRHGVATDDQLARVLTALREEQNEHVFALALSKCVKHGGLEGLKTAIALVDSGRGEARRYAMAALWGVFDWPTDSDESSRPARGDSRESGLACLRLWLPLSGDADALLFDESERFVVERLRRSWTVQRR